MSKLSKSLDSLISAIPDKKNKAIKWTFQEDAALLKYAETKGVAALADAMGKPRSATYARYSYLKTLTKAKK